jgi:hypothetical protein
MANSIASKWCILLWIRYAFGDTPNPKVIIVEKSRLVKYSARFKVRGAHHGLNLNKVSTWLKVRDAHPTWLMWIPADMTAYLAIATY